MKEEINWGSDLLNDIMKFLEDKEYYDNIGRSIMLPDDAELFSTRLTILIRMQVINALSQQREEMKELANTFDTILKSDMCHEEQLETLLKAVQSKLSQQREKKTRIKEAWENELELKTKHVRIDTIKECITWAEEKKRAFTEGLEEEEIYAITEVIMLLQSKLEKK